MATSRTEEDRRERRRKLGLPEELTDEEKAAEAAKRAEATKAKTARALPVKPISLITQLRDVLVPPFPPTPLANPSNIQCCWLAPWLSHCQPPQIWYCGSEARYPATRGADGET